MSDADASPSSPTLELSAASKSFGHVNALVGASLAAHAGQVLALVGDNGAGKSTMIKLIAGVYSMDSGDLRINGERVELSSPAHAQALGVSTVFQDLALVEVLDIAANMYLGRPPPPGAPTGSSTGAR